MTKYNWSRSLLDRYKKDVVTSFEFGAALESYHNGFAAIDNTRFDKAETLTMNNKYIKLNPFMQDAISMIPDEMVVLGQNAPRKILTIDEALELTNAFYSSATSDTINQIFVRAFDDRDGRLRAVKPSRFHRFSGHSYTSVATKEYLIDFVSTQDLDMFYTIIHEFGHVISFYLRNCTKATVTFDPFSEVESIFPELLSASFITDRFGEEYSRLNRQRMANDVLTIAADIKTDFLIREATKKLGTNRSSFSISEFIKRAHEYDESLTPAVVKKRLKYPLSDDAPYFYSTLVAIELYYIYMQDPEYASYLYSEILLFDGSNTENYQELLGYGIRPGEHFEDFTRTLR